MHLARITVGLTLAFILFAVADAQAIAVIPVKVSKLYEVQGESTTSNGRHFLAWTQTATPNAWGHGWNVMLSIDGVRHQISRRGSFSFPGGFSDAGTLVFQQEFVKNPGNSDLYLWQTGHISRFPIPINSAHWEYGGDLYGGWLVYGVNQFRRRSSPWEIVSYNLATKGKHILARSTYGCGCVDTGNVVGTLASYRLNRRIVVQDVTGTAPIGYTVPPTGWFDDDAFLVDPTPGVPGDETLYWVRARSHACGRGVKIMKASLSDLGNPIVVDTLHPGADAISLSVDDSTGTPNLFFGRGTCTKVSKGDLYEIPSA